MAGGDEASVSDVDVGIKRVYRKRSESRKSSHSSGTAAVRVTLNKLSEQDVADAKMASVFPDTAVSTKTPLRVNPLYDKNGTVEVEASELRRSRAGSEAGSTATATTNGGVKRLDHQQPNGSVNTVSQNIPMEGPRNSAPPLAYAGNFELRGNQPATQKTPRNGGPADSHTVDLGRVLPARVQKNTSRSYLPPTIPSTSPFMTPRQSLKGDAPVPPAAVSKTEIEHVMRRARIRRWWRCILFVILSVLVFALIVILVVVFTMR